MDLLDVLGWVGPRRFPRECEPTVRLLQGRWIEAGSPIEPAALREWLNRALEFCEANHMRYLKFYVKRAAQMRRREWAPRAAEA
jgi:hypothetical protein